LGTSDETAGKNSSDNDRNAPYCSTRDDNVAGFVVQHTERNLNPGQHPGLDPVHGMLQAVETHTKSSDLAF
jgi:hypothetical protein